MSNWDTFSKNISNYAVGATEMPAELTKFIADLYTYGQGKLGTLDTGEMQQQYNTINEQTKKLEPVRQIAPEYVNWLENQPNADAMQSLGNIAGGAISGGLFRNALQSGVSLVKNPNILKQMLLWSKKNPMASGTILGTARGARGEAITEPMIENMK